MRLLECEAWNPSALTRAFSESSYIRVAEICQARLQSGTLFRYLVQALM
jgi:hypothetical protein